MNVLSNAARLWVTDAENRELAIFSNKGFEIFEVQTGGKTKRVAFSSYTAATKNNWTNFKKLVKEYHRVVITDAQAPGFLTGNFNPDW